MMKSCRRGIAFLLTLMLVFTFIPAQATALSPGLEITNAGADPVTALPPSLTDGAVWTDKSVAYEGNGVFNITLSAAGQDYKVTNPEPLALRDVVLVLDTSGSMGDTVSGQTKLSSMRAAAKQAVDTLLTVQGNRVAIVEYAGTADLVSDFSSNAANLKGAIDNFVAGGGTNIQNGFLKAQNVINGRSDKANKPVVILMTDGDPTYGYSDLDTHNSNTRLGNGYSYEGNEEWQLSTSYKNGTLVWQTVKQAMHTKDKVREVCNQELDIYTIGFGVNSLNSQSKAFAEATLMPTEANTRAYRPSVTLYSGEKRAVSQTGPVQYYRTSRDYGSTWTDWNPSNPGDHGYVAPSGPITGGAWASFSNAASAEDSWDAPVKSGSVFDTSYTDNKGSKRRQIGYFTATRTGTEYRNVTSATVKEPFNHKYWEEESTITGGSASDIVNAFVTIINKLVNFKPMSSTSSGGVDQYSDITITDVLGGGFEVDGTLPENVTLGSDGTTLTWVINGDSFITMPAGSTTISASAIATASFKVKLRNDVSQAGTYLTNDIAKTKAFFRVNEDNPAYAETSVNHPLTNTGQVTLAFTPVNATITVEKTVTGSAIGSNTFTFNLYDNPAATGLPLNSTPVSVTVNGVGSNSASVDLSIAGEKFINGGETTVYVRELGNPGEFWTYDTEIKSVKISRDNVSGKASFVNRYDPEGTLTVNKAWPQNGPGAVSSVAFYLEKKVDGSWTRINSNTPYTLKAADNWTLEIPGLQLGTEYRVSELPGSLTQDYYATSSPGSVVFDASDLSREITISNQYITPTGDITIKKNWFGGSEEDLPDYVTFNYEYVSEGITTSGSVSMNASGAVTNDGVVTWTYKMSGLGFGTYTFTEQKVQDYAATAASQSVTLAQDPIASRSALVTFENTYVTPSGLLTVEKKWENENNDTRFRPTSGSIIVKLFQKLTGSEEETQYGQDITLSDSNGWKKTFDNLAWGQYRVEEITNVPDYTTTYSALSIMLEKGTRNDISSRTGLITISNIFNNPTGTITVVKNWVESGLETVDRPSEITVDLFRNGEPYDSITFSGITGSGNTSSHTFTGLPLSGIYTVSESASSADDASKLAVYEQSVSYGENNRTGIVLNPIQRAGAAYLTNTCARGTITVNKDWQDGNNPLADRPNEAKITLYQVKTYVITEETIDPDNIITNDDDGTTRASIVTTTRSATTTTAVDTKVLDRSASPAALSAVFYDLELGEDITYYVVEEPIPFYSTAYHADYSGNDRAVRAAAGPDGEDVSAVPDAQLLLTEETPNGIFTVTNTYTDPKGTLTVIKNWNHGNNPSPETEVTVKLYEVTGEVSTYVTEATFSGSYTFEGLTLGAVYAVDENDVDQYETTYGTSDFTYAPVKNYNSGTVEPASVTITNEYIPETGCLQVTKNWDGSTGSAITITLTRYYQGEGGQTADTAFNAAAPTIELNEDNRWTDTFSGLEVYGPGGVKYDYRAVESGEDLWMYTHDVIQDVQLTPDQQSKLTITNRYTPDQGTLTVTKRWIGGSNYPESINYRLYVNGVAQEGYRTLSAAKDWTDTLTGLDVTKIYSVKEINVAEEYNTTYSGREISFGEGNLTAAAIITNTRTEDATGITLTKEVDQDKVILKDGKAQFTYTLTIENTGNRTLTDLYADDQMTVSGAAVGANIVYVTSSALELEGTNGARITPLVTTLAPGASTTAVYTVIVDQEGEYNNTATAYGAYGQRTVSSDPAEELAIVKDMDLVIDKEVLSSKNITGTGGSFLYRLTVRNAGDFDLYGVEAADVMTSTNPNAAMIYSYNADANPNNVTYIADGHKFMIGDLPAGAEIVITYTVTVSGEGTYNNTATVNGEYENEYGYGKLSDSDQETVTVTKPYTPPDRPDKPKKPTPTDPEILIPDEPVPEAPVILEDEPVPAGPLPKTGGLDALILYGLGALLAGGGIALRRREKNK